MATEPTINPSSPILQFTIHYSPFTIHRSIASFLIHDVQEGVPVQVPPEIFAEQGNGSVHVAWRRAGDVRGNDDVLEIVEGAVGGQRLPLEHIEPCAGN